MIQKALQYLVQLGRQEIVQIGGKQFTLGPSGLKYIADPLPARLDFHTLSGLAEYVTCDVDNLSRGGAFLHVESPWVVSLLRPLRHDDMARMQLAQSTPLQKPQHRFGQFMPAEEFAIWLMTGFADGEDRAGVVRLVGNMRAEKVQTLTDDGFTQVAAVKAGVTRVSEIEVKNPVTLRPYRTFPEAEQPTSPFILRLKEDDGAIMAALFEVQDPTWMVRAAENIRDRLREEVGELAIDILI